MADAEPNSYLSVPSVMKRTLLQAELDKGMTRTLSHIIQRDQAYTGVLDGKLSALGLAEPFVQRGGQSLEKTTGEALPDQGDVDPASKLIETTWIYHDNRAAASGINRPAMRGTAIVDSTGLVQRFLHACCSSGPFVGMSSSVGAQFLAERGYRLAPEGPRAVL